MLAHGCCCTFVQPQLCSCWMVVDELLHSHTGPLNISWLFVGHYYAWNEFTNYLNATFAHLYSHHIPRFIVHKLCTQQGIYIFNFKYKCKLFIITMLSVWGYSCLQSTIIINTMYLLEDSNICYLLWEKND